MICGEKADQISVVRQQNISAVELLSHGIGGGRLNFCVYVVRLKRETFCHVGKKSWMFIGGHKLQRGRVYNFDHFSKYLFRFAECDKPD